jgi:hypothetical protein
MKRYKRGYMKKVLVVSICEKVKKIKNKHYSYEFHFIGFLHGQKIRKINVQVESKVEIELDEEYILYLDILNIKGELLETKLIKCKPIKKICYGSS